MSAPQEELLLDIEGMTCASCVTKVERALSSVPQVEEASVNLATRPAVVRPAADARAITEAVRRAGEGLTTIAVRDDGEVAGLVAVEDAVKPGAAEAIARLRAMGLRVAMVTGDRRPPPRRSRRVSGSRRCWPT